MLMNGGDVGGDGRCFGVNALVFSEVCMLG